MLTLENPVTRATVCDEIHARKIHLIADKNLSLNGRLSLLEASTMPETERPGQSTDLAKKPVSLFTAALQNAWKKGVVEKSTDACTEVNIQCQKEPFRALIIPFTRGHSQQAPCFRY